MESQDYSLYIVTAALFGFFLWRHLKFRALKGAIPSLLNQGASIVDVRGVDEFRRGSSAGSVNIPLIDLHRRISEIDKTKPVILCCASGARSSTAARVLKDNGYQNVINAGPWTNTVLGRSK